MTQTLIDVREYVIELLEDAAAKTAKAKKNGKGKSKKNNKPAIKYVATEAGVDGLIILTMNDDQQFNVTVAHR